MAISLEGSIRTCKVDTAWASKMESDRWLNPRYQFCPTWNGTDLTGRPVCEDTFLTKRRGCNSALDRVDVENSLRPQYAEYVNLDARGLLGYNLDYPSPVQEDLQDAAYAYDQYKHVTGNFGLDLRGAVYPTCRGYRSQQAEAEFRHGPCQQPLNAVQSVGKNPCRDKMMYNIDGDFLNYDENRSCRGCGY